MDELTRMSATLNLPIFSIIENLSNGQAKNISIPIQLGARAIKAVEDFKNLIDNLRNESENLDLIELIDSVITRTGFRRHLENDEQSEERIENIGEFRSSAREYAQSKGQEALIAFMESIALVSDIDGLEENLDFIPLITLHQAKGLEFPLVLIAGMEEGLFPHSNSLNDYNGIVQGAIQVINAQDYETGEPISFNKQIVNDLENFNTQVGSYMNQRKLLEDLEYLFE